MRRPYHLFPNEWEPARVYMPQAGHEIEAGQGYAGIAYITFQNLDLSNVPAPKMYVEWIKGRKTLHWRGRKFTVPAPRPRIRW